MNTFLYYSQEIKQRLFYVVFGLFSTALATFLEIQPVIGSLAKPLGGIQLVLTDLTEFYFVTILLSFYFGGLLFFPSLVYFSWSFLAPSLYQSEKNRVSFYCFATITLLFISQYVMVVTFVPWFVSFFFAVHQDSKLLQCLPKLVSYIRFLLRASVTTLIACQIPGLLYVCIKQKIISQFVLLRKWSYMAFIFISAFIAPPDIFSQFLLSSTLLIFYELLAIYSLWLASGAKALKPT